ncbi:MAG: hypothetical protein ACRC57_03255 [Sarcina sp.]
MLISKFRDLVLMEFSEGKVLTISCDNSNNLGVKNEEIKIDEEILGYLTARVCMFKTLCYGALPKVIVNNLYVDDNQKKEKSTRGIYTVIDEFNSLNFERKLTDENLVDNTDEVSIEGIQASSGITLIGEELEEERLWEIDKGDLLVTFGECFTTDNLMNFSQTEENLLSMKSLKVILDYSKDVVIIGHKGVENKIKLLEETNGVNIQITNLFECKENLSVASMVMAIVEEDMLAKIERRIDEKINIIGNIQALK